MKRTVIGAAVLALGISTVGVASADKPGDTDTTKTSHDSVTFDCGDGDTVVFAGPDTLWPPNHKLVAQEVTATDGDDGDMTTNPAVDESSDATTITIVPSADEVANGVGDGNTDVDYSFPEGLTGEGDPSATLPFSVRAERSGKGDGRTYTFHWSATFDGANPLGNSCSSEDDDQAPYVVFVPHDQGKGNDA